MNAGDSRAIHPRISVVIAAKDAARFLPHVFDSLMNSTIKDFEVVISDDCSSDDTVRMAEEWGAVIVRHPESVGAAIARNHGAQRARSPILFFTDHDCCVLPDTLERAIVSFQNLNEKTILGGTYDIDPVDGEHFASRFQSLHVHYSETRCDDPDYIASHALVMDRESFLREGGFPESLSRVLPNGCCQDVLMAHMMKKRGYRLKVDPGILVLHMFNFTFYRSLKNAYWKSRSWIRVAMGSARLISDSGSASTEMKLSGITTGLSACFFVAALAHPVFLPLGLILYVISLLCNISFLRFLLKKSGLSYTIRATPFYSIQLLVVLAGAIHGLLQGPIRPDSPDV